jgi:hypothetical protein
VNTRFPYQSREMLAQNVANSRRLRTECDVTHVGMIYTLSAPDGAKRNHAKYLIVQPKGA